MEKVKIRLIALQSGVSYPKLLAFFDGKNNLKGSELTAILPYLFSIGATIDHQLERVETLIKMHEVI